MKHELLFKRIINDLHEPWMNAQDKAEFDAEMMRMFSAEIDAAIETGIANGYTAEQQESMVRPILKTMLQPRMPDLFMPDHCMCEACKDGITLHKSDCAVHSEPAYRNGPCDCMPRVAAKCHQQNEQEKFDENVEHLP
jgi:hypothetical protein